MVMGVGSFPIMDICSILLNLARDMDNRYDLVSFAINNVLKKQKGIPFWNALFDMQCLK